jgi:hypothetical protein
VWGKFVFPLCGKEKAKRLSSNFILSFSSFFLSFPFHVQFSVTRAWTDWLAGWLLAGWLAGWLADQIICMISSHQSASFTIKCTSMKFV